jgi:hypothetical protein
MNIHDRLYRSHWRANLSPPLPKAQERGLPDTTRSNGSAAASRQIAGKRAPTPAAEASEEAAHLI